MIWYDANFAYKKAIVIPHGNVSGGSDLLDFPLLISLIDSDLRTMVLNNTGLMQTFFGYDLLFTDSTETRELAYEVESYDGGEGSLLCWVRVPILSASHDTLIYLYFGNPLVSNNPNFAGAVSALSNPNQVWKSYYRGVWHLGDVTTDILSLTDSTSHGNDGTNHSATADTGEINGGAGFDGSAQYIDMGDPANGSLDFGTSDFTLEAWFTVPSLPGAISAILNKGADGISAGYGISINSSNQIRASIQASGGTNQQITGPTLVANEWYHVAAAFHRNDQVYLYLNGALVASSSYSSGNTNSVSSTSHFNLGRRTNGTGHFGGTIDEVRVSTVACSANWIATEYANQIDPSGFIQLGSTIPYAGNADVALLSAFPASTMQSSLDYLNVAARGMSLVFMPFLYVADERFTLEVQGKDIASGQYYTLATFAGISTSGIAHFILYPGLTSSSTVVSTIVPRCFRIVVIPSTGEAAEYTVGSSLIT